MSARRLNAALARSAPVFAALGDETRLRIVARLVNDGPQSITQLTSGEEITRQAVTKHLHVLEGAGLLKCSRQGREQQWQLEAKKLEEARRWLDQIAAQWDTKLDALQKFIEDEGPGGQA